MGNLLEQLGELVAAEKTAFHDMHNAWFGISNLFIGTNNFGKVMGAASASSCHEVPPSFDWWSFPRCGSIWRSMMLLESTTDLVEIDT
ncbi:MAG: hypothetical protein JJU27_12210 [Gammaproteobacteria bacterium]|nr:hypothetical protein [Gammaproteobacteria bacterium]